VSTSFMLILSASAFFLFLYIAIPAIVFQPSISIGAVVGASGRGVSLVSVLAGGGVDFAVVEAIASWHSGYLIMRTSSTSWVAEVAGHEFIRLYSGDASHSHCMVGHPFAGIVGSLSVTCALLYLARRVAHYI
jgi:hypothetical protein